MDITLYLAKDVPETEIKLPLICSLSKFFTSYLDAGLLASKKNELGTIERQDGVKTLGYLGICLKLVIQELSQQDPGKVDALLSQTIDTGMSEYGVQGIAYDQMTSEQFAKVCLQFHEHFMAGSNNVRDLSPVNDAVMISASFYQNYIWQVLFENLDTNAGVMDQETWVMDMIILLVSICASLVKFGLGDPLAILVNPENPTASIIV